jgi:uncharacterized protein DUF5996
LEQWPSLPLTEWDDTRATLHLWTQIVGKIRLARTPVASHWWNVPLYLRSTYVAAAETANWDRSALER